MYLTFPLKLSVYVVSVLGYNDNVVMIIFVRKF